MFLWPVSGPRIFLFRDDLVADLIDLICQKNKSLPYNICIFGLAGFRGLEVQFLNHAEFGPIIAGIADPMVFLFGVAAGAFLLLVG